MKGTFLRLASVFALALGFAACSSSDDPEPVKVPPKVYIATGGDLYTDGIKHRAFEGTEVDADAVFVDERGVHVAGRHYDHDVPNVLPAYWLNGTKTILPADVPAWEEGRGYGVAAGNGHVYVAGQAPSLASYNYDARLWVDGRPTDLEGVDGSMTTCAMGVMLHGSDAYVYGGDFYYNFNSGTLEWHGIVWKNGKQLASTDFLLGGYISDFAIARDGTMYALCNGFSYEDCGLFKVNPSTGKFVPVVLGSSGAMFSNLFIDGNDVYVVGLDEDSARKTHWMLWKNGEASPLTIPDDWNFGRRWWPCCVPVHDGTVYVAGWVPVLLSDSTIENRLCLWRDGKMEIVYAENTGNNFTSMGFPHIFVR